MIKESDGWYLKKSLVKICVVTCPWSMEGVHTQTPAGGGANRVLSDRGILLVLDMVANLSQVEERKLWKSGT
jgi:hypothetical protein